jgi:hypothetical protein
MLPNESQSLPYSPSTLSPLVDHVMANATLRFAPRYSPKVEPKVSMLRTSIAFAIAAILPALGTSKDPLLPASLECPFEFAHPLLKRLQRFVSCPLLFGLFLQPG